MHRIKLHSVAVIGCAQNKAKHCTPPATAIAPHVQTFLRQFRLHFEHYEMFMPPSLRPDCWIVTEKVTGIKIRCKAQCFWRCTALRVNNVTEWNREHIKHKLLNIIKKLIK